MGCSNSKDLFIHTEITTTTHSPTPSQENSPNSNTSTTTTTTSTTTTNNDRSYLNFHRPHSNHKNAFVSVLDEENNSNSEKSIEVCCSYQIQFKGCINDKDDVIIHRHNLHANVNNTNEEEEKVNKIDVINIETDPLPSSSSSERMELDPILLARSLSTTLSATGDSTEEILDGSSGLNAKSDQKGNNHSILPSDTKLNHEKNLNQNDTNSISNIDNNDPKMGSNENITVKATDNNTIRSYTHTKVVDNSSSLTSPQTTNHTHGSNNLPITKPEKMIQTSEVITIQTIKNNEEQITIKANESKHCDEQKMMQKKQVEDKQLNPPSRDKIITNTVTREDVYKLGEMTMEQKVQNFLELNSRGDIMSSKEHNDNNMVALSPKVNKKVIDHNNQSHHLKEDGRHFLFSKETDEKKDETYPQQKMDIGNKTNVISSPLNLESPYREKRKRIKKKMDEENPIEKQMMNLIQNIEKQQQSIRQQRLQCENNAKVISQHDELSDLLPDNHNQNSSKSSIKEVCRKGSKKIHRDAKKDHSQAILMAQRLKYFQTF